MRGTAAAAAGGVIGALARWIVAAPFDVEQDSFPWVVLAVNIVGALGIGIAATRLEAESVRWTFVVTGILGGFTTMSGFALGFVDLVDADRTAAAVAYLAVTSVAGLCAAVLGEQAAERRTS